MKLEKKLENLAACGITLREGLDKSVLTESWSLEELEEDDSYDGLLVAFCGPEAEDPNGYCDSLMYFDTELGSLPGQYGEIIQQLGRLSQGALHIEPFDDDVDFGPCDALLEFTANGQAVSVSFQQNDDWFNWTVTDVLVAELKKTGSELRYFAVDTGGQDVVLGCLKPEQIERLASFGVDVQLLTGSDGPDGPQSAQEGRAGHDAGVAYVSNELNKPRPWWQRLFGK
jgi:hypothetical protein